MSGDRPHEVLLGFCSGVPLKARGLVLAIPFFWAVEELPDPDNVVAEIEKWLNEPSLTRIGRVMRLAGCIDAGVDQADAFLSKAERSLAGLQAMTPDIDLEIVSEALTAFKRADLAATWRALRAGRLAPGALAVAADTNQTTPR